MKIYFSSVRTNTIFILLMAITVEIHAQPGRIAHSASDHEFTLSNPFFERRIQFDEHENRIYTNSFLHVMSGHHYILPNSREFCFSINGHTVSGIDGIFRYRDHTITENSVRSTLKIEFSGLEGSPSENLQLCLYYEIYGDLAMVRKWIEIPNTDGEIFYLFRNDQQDPTHTFTLPWCEAENAYVINDVLSNKEVGKFSGHELKNEGLKVTIDRINQAGIFEIRPLGRND